GDFGNGANPGNANNIVQTGNIIADCATVYGYEAWLNLGPAWILSEGCLAYANDAVVGGKGVGNLGFFGWDVQAGYFLTGENRTCARRFGRIATNYLNGPFTPFWFVRDEEGRCCSGIGAWEIAARYSVTNLNDGPIQGGVLHGCTLGLNWYLTT